MELKARAEKGNVIFLILLAVALFAALSYAVTKHTEQATGTPAMVKGEVPAGMRCTSWTSN